MLRILAGLLFLFVAACSDDGPVGPDPYAGLVGEPCTSGANCRTVDGQVTGAPGSNNYKLLSKDGAAWFNCPVNLATLDRATLGTRWRCDWVAGS